MISVQRILEVNHKIYGYVKTTPLQENETLSNKYDCRVLLKREDLQLGRSYKIRGAFNKISSLNEEERNWTYAFFNSYIDDDGRFLSEDYGFCRYWQKIGGKIWVDPGINIKHLGRLNFEGSMIDQLVDMSKEMSPKQLP